MSPSTELQFHAPQSLPDALRLMSSAPPGTPARPLAGGSDLIVQMRAGRLKTPSVVDLKRIPDLIGIRRDGEGWWIGAATPCVQIGEHAGLRADWPGVVEAACLIGSPQVQGRASLGGNLCNGSPAADSVPALIAAGATLVIGAQGAGGAVVQREIPVEMLPAGPGRTHLLHGELLLAVRLPARAARVGDAYLRLIPRTEMDIAVAGCGAMVALDGQGRVVDARVALGAVAPTAVLVPSAAEAILGSTLDPQACARLEAAARAACVPIDDKRGSASYRTRIAGVLARRAALLAYGRAAGTAGITQESGR